MYYYHNDCIEVYIRSISFNGYLPNNLYTILDKIEKELFASDHNDLSTDSEYGRVKFYFIDEKLYNAKLNAKKIDLL